MLATADTARTNKVRKIQRDADRFMSSPLSFPRQATPPARTHIRSLTNPTPSRRVRQHSWFCITPVSPALETNPVSI